MELRTEFQEMFNEFKTENQKEITRVRKSFQDRLAKLTRDNRNLNLAVKDVQLKNKKIQKQMKNTIEKETKQE